MNLFSWATIRELNTGTIFFKKLCTYLQIDFSGRPFPFPHLVFHCALSGDVELEDRHEGAQGPGQELSGRT